MSKKKAFIFPAFITEFTGKEISFLQHNHVNINDYLQAISKCLPIDLPEFSYDHHFYKEELNSQLIAYSFSCAFNDILKSKKIVPDYIAGYSMGIYASLYAAGSIHFNEGAKLIFEAYNLIKNLSGKRLYGMGAIVGLSSNELNTLLLNGNYSLEIINTNNEHSLVLSGKKDDLTKLLRDVKNEGALSAVELTVNTPYHSTYLKPFADLFKKYINQLHISDCQIPVISTFNQREFYQVKDIKMELVMNLTEKINWYKTMQTLIKNNVTEMYECGAGKDLKKISRFIKGDYQIKSIYKS